MAIRWNIQDRATGKEIVVGQPRSNADCETLQSIIKNCSNVGLSPLGKFNNTHKKGA